jgi:transcriptional regulator with XRE-family HTH domain
MPLPGRIKKAQALLGFNSQQMAAALGITPEWISKITNGRVQGSTDIGLRLDQVLRERSIDPTSMEVDPSSISGPPPAELRKELTRRFGQLLDEAGADVVRLGWVSEQMHAHLTPPAHWSNQVPPIQKVSPGDHPAVIRAEEEGRASGRRKMRQYVEDGGLEGGGTTGSAASGG